MLLCHVKSLARPRADCGGLGFDQGPQHGLRRVADQVERFAAFEPGGDLIEVPLVQGHRVLLLRCGAASYSPKDTRWPQPIRAGPSNKTHHSGGLHRPGWCANDADGAFKGCAARLQGRSVRHRQWIARPFSDHPNQSLRSATWGSLPSDGSAVSLPGGTNGISQGVH